MRIVFDEKFLKRLQKLPHEIQRKADTLLALLVIDVRTPALHVKKLKGLDGIYSFRVTHDYRALFHFMNEDTIRILDVAPRKDIYRL